MNDYFLLLLLLLLLLRIFTLIPHFCSLVALSWTTKSKIRINCLHLTARKCTAECQQKNHVSKVLVAGDAVNTCTGRNLLKVLMTLKRKQTAKEMRKCCVYMLQGAKHWKTKLSQV